MFSKVFDEQKYKKALEVCCLQSDVDNMPANDQTEIGDKGVNLSGGQKARIALARAVYQDTDIYLLDDPLSACNYEVAERMFYNCLLDYLSGKTRILVTHQLMFLDKVDRIIVLKDGKIVEQGSYKNLVNNDKSVLVNEILRSSSCVQLRDTEPDQDDDQEENQSNEKPTKQKGVLIEKECRVENSGISLKLYSQYFKL